MKFEGYEFYRGFLKFGIPCGVFLWAMIFLCFNAFATDYFVKNGGSDSNTGLSDAQAWATIAKVNAQTFSAADRIAFNQGDTWEIGADEQLEPDSGTWIADVTYTQYGTGAKPKFNVANTKDQGIYAFLKEYFIIDNIQFSGGKTDQKFIFLDSCNNVQINNSYFTGIDPQFAIYSYHDSNPAVDVFNITINSCEFETTASNDAIRFATFSTVGNTRNIKISDCDFTDLPATAIRFFITQTYTDAGQAPQYIDIEDNTMNDIDRVAIIFDSGKNVTLARNDCDDIGDDSIANINAFQMNNIKTLLIEDNNINNVKTSVPDGHAIILDWGYTSNDHLTEDAVVRRNRLSNCLAGSSSSGVEIFKAINSKVYNNIIILCSRGMQLVNSQSSGNSFFNNTTSDIISYCMTIRSSAPICNLKNNIFKGGTYGVRVESNGVIPTEDYNSYYDNSMFKFYDATTSAEITIGSNSITSDPLLSDNFSIPTNSPAKDAGVALSDVLYDFRRLRRPRGSAYDIGAYEFGSTVSFRKINLSGVNVN